MARLRQHASIRPAVTAMVFAVAVTVAFVMAISEASAAGRPAPARELAAELLILRGDLGRLGEAGLSAKNRQGLRQRIAGALGLLPWLLRQAGDEAAAERLRVWQGRPLDDAAERTALVVALDAAIARHPLDRAVFSIDATPARLNEARAIHRTYCAGCHDGTGNGAPDLALPARDLFAMARKELVDEFLARMVNGVKGDASIHFANPLTDRQIGALWALYRSQRAPEPSR
jgi:cytochrome c553